jgi:putative sigma-54 modulation protein
MMIDLRSSTLPISEALREHIVRRLDFAVRRFASRVHRIVVRLVDVNGPRGGPDKRCRIIAHLSPSGSVIVEATDADAYAAASQAATRLDERVARALTKRRPRPLSTRRGGARYWRNRFPRSPQEGELS